MKNNYITIHPCLLNVRNSVTPSYFKCHIMKKYGSSFTNIIHTGIPKRHILHSSPFITLYEQCTKYRFFCIQYMLQYIILSFFRSTYINTVILKYQLNTSSRMCQEPNKRHVPTCFIFCWL